MSDHMQEYGWLYFLVSFAIAALLLVGFVLAPDERRATRARCDALFGMAHTGTDSLLVATTNQDCLRLLTTTSETDPA